MRVAHLERERCRLLHPRGVARDHLHAHPVAGRRPAGRHPLLDELRRLLIEDDFELLDADVAHEIGRDQLDRVAPLAQRDGLIECPVDQLGGLAVDQETLAVPEPAAQRQPLHGRHQRRRRLELDRRRFLVNGDAELVLADEPGRRHHLDRKALFGRAQGHVDAEPALGVRVGRCTLGAIGGRDHDAGIGFGLASDRDHLAIGHEVPGGEAGDRPDRTPPPPAGPA